jgi:4-hydroxy-tetrahydrodipicolinate synthase
MENGYGTAKKSMTASPGTIHIRSLRMMTAIKTPYRQDGHVDFEAYDRIVEHQIKNGVEALIIGGTTGEGHLFSWEEHLLLIGHTAAKYKGKIAIVGNTGSNCTSEAAYATKKGFSAGMDCSLLINPYYGKTSERGIVMHLDSCLKYGPAIIYNVPGRTGQDIKPHVIMQIAGHENFVGVKECMGNDRIKELSDQGVACWSGNDDQCYEARHKAGAVGVISVTSNVVPGLVRKLMFDQDDALNDKLKPLYKWLFTEPNPIGVNTMLMQLGVVKPVFRLPYTHLDKPMREEGIKILESVGIEHTPGSGYKMQVLEDSDFKHMLNGDAD